MEEMKLTINMLPKGAWNNDLSKTLPKNDWDILRKYALKRAKGRCEICGYETDELDAHEEWDFDIKRKTQILTKIIAICSRCHGVKHFKNSVRLGFGEEAEKHFIKVNKCSEMQFASHLNKAIIDYKERNKVFRWKMVADLKCFGGNGIEIKQNTIPLIKNPYQDVDWFSLSYEDMKKLFEIKRNDYLIGAPKIVSIEVDNYQGTIQVKTLFTDRIEWILDDKIIDKKYNVIGPFATKLKIKEIIGKNLKFKLVGIGGETISKTFEVLPQEVL